MKLNFNTTIIEKKVEALREQIRELEQNKQPKIYDVETDSFRVMTSAEKEEELKRLNKALDTLWYMDGKRGEIEAND